MKAFLICPSDRPGVPELARRAPLAIAPLLGRTVLDYWIEALAPRGVREITIFAADRPNRIREHVGSGQRWGVQIEVVPTGYELSVDEARRKAPVAEVEKPTADDVIVVDHLPGQENRPLFESYAGWIAALQAWLPHAATPGRVGARELRPGVFVGLHAEVAPSARLEAPCWIGDDARIGARVRIGPGTIVDDRTVIAADARIKDSVIGPDTYVGRHVSVDRSIALGAQLINWGMNSCVQVPDSFLLADLGSRRQPRRTTLIGRSAALLALVISAPFAIGVVLLSLLRGYPPWHLRLALRAHHVPRGLAEDTFDYYELTGAFNWLRRWPQFWNVFRGDMAWFGNRPLRPTQAMSLANDFERLWLAAPVGLISLADAHGCRDGLGDEALAHASYYAVHAGWRLDAFIFFRSLLRAALVWPILGHRRRETSVPLQDLATRQEL